MNVVHLRYARAVAQEGSFGRAARACSVTQPALSNGIAVLERTLGGRLFDRTTRGVTPTPLGERVLPLIENTLRGLDAVMVEARLTATSKPRPLRVGVTTLINRDLIGRMFETVNAVRPEHGVVLRAASMTELRQALIEAELDLLLMPASDPAPGFQQATVAREPMAFLTAPSSPALAERGTSAPIELGDTTAAPFVLSTNACGLAPFTRKIFADSGLTLSTYAGEAHDCRILQDWVALGLGSALLPRSKIVDGAAAREVWLDNAPVMITYEAYWLPTSPMREEVASVVTMLAADLSLSVLDEPDITHDYLVNGDGDLPVGGELVSPLGS